MAGRDLTKEELVRRAGELVPVLRKRAVRAEQLRQIPPESIRDLLSSGLIRIGNPDRYGGHGVEIDAAFDVGWELGRGCGSTAWCYSYGASHHAALSWDAVAEQFGRQALGLPPGA